MTGRPAQSGAPAQPEPGPRDGIDAAADMLKRLGHPARLAIVRRLIDGEATVAEMEAELALRQPGLSQQLAELRGAGLVAPSRSGKNIRYRLVDESVVPLIAALDRIFRRQDGAAEPSGRDSGFRSEAARAPVVSPLLGAAMFARVGRAPEAADATPPGPGRPETPVPAVSE